MTAYKRRRSYDPVWKRELPSAVDDAADVMSGYEQQLTLNLNKPKDATPEQFEEWQEKELNWWAERQLSFVAVMSIVQVCMLGLMGATMLLNSILFK
tara:strand:- start:4881 stop:5171 length:291 start_codon:yes stop_codon:yes gene_type:complete